MKTGYSILFALFLFSFGGYAQDIVYEPIQSHLNEDQKDDLEKARKAIERTSSYISKAESIENEYSKYKNSNKKRHKKKYEKKTWEAKKYRLTAEGVRQKSYKTAVDVYSGFLEEAEFYFEEDKEEALKLNETAVAKIEEAEKIIGFYDEAEKKGDYKRAIEYNKMSSDISKTQRLQEEAYDNQTRALSIFLKQEEKRSAIEADETAWRKAKLNDNIPAYRQYINDFPNGKYVAEAQAKIAELEEEERQRNLNNKKEPTSEYSFCVQLASSRTPLSENKIKRYYGDPSKVTEVIVGNEYKYRVGNYPKYEQAYEFKETIMQSVRVTRKKERPFIVAYDRDGNEVDITDDMKPAHLIGKY